MSESTSAALAKQVIRVLAAIEFAFVVRDRGEDGLVWLNDWRQGEPYALRDVEEYIAANRGDHIDV